ncbi:phage tail tape-measure protein [Afipia massiliensis]|uniref:Phage tail tape-measure protein n=1 Tax=Afipia massiliensis TaxID=211460 RepID=A0A840N643_9BRAD|nr:phage tail tape-measure protein [Afipia massiliensis]
MLLPGIGGAIGGMLGGYAGGMVDQQNGEADRLRRPDQDLRAPSSSYGSVIPTLYGKSRLTAPAPGKMQTYLDMCAKLGPQWTASSQLNDSRASQIQRSYWLSPFGETKPL